ncbi:MULTISPECIES: DUF4279 domain-containing protein [Polymorphospora]|uniref:DUF4279 domain-containing protein n=1 Tax=Polymorphospora lycopeni TaxID=3140240 RepID=A0ABV5CSL3_9ACTN
MTGGPLRWENVSVALIVTRADLVPDEITSRLDWEPAVARTPGSPSAFRPGVGCWVGGYDDSFSTDPHRQLDALLARLSRRATVLAELRAEGCTVQIDIAADVANRAEFTLAPAELATIAGLGLPLSFTFRSAVPNSEAVLDELFPHLKRT